MDGLFSGKPKAPAAFNLHAIAYHPHGALAAAAFGSPLNALPKRGHQPDRVAMFRHIVNTHDVDGAARHAVCGNHCGANSPLVARPLNNLADEAFARHTEANRPA